MMYTLASSQSWHHKLIFRSPPGSETAAWSDGLFMMIFWFSAFFFVLLMGLMVYWTIKYRRRPGVAAPRSPHHNTPLEIIWTVVPSSALLVIFLFGFQGYLAKMVTPSQSLELNISAWKWNWAATYPSGVESPEFQYIEGGESEEFRGKEYPIFYVPENTSVTLRMSSRDVIHAFWIPDFRTKMDVYPNRYTGFSFTTPVLGAEEVVIDNSGDELKEIPGRDMWVFCAEYCGDEHSRMAATIRVVPIEVYEAKIQDWGTPKNPIELGETIWRGRCAICHTIDGTPNTGPSWLDVYGSTGSVVVDNTTQSILKDDNYIRESIYEPNAKFTAGYAGGMTSFQGVLDETQLNGVIAFMKTLSQYAPEPVDLGGEGGDAEADPESTETEPSEVNDGGES